MAVAFSWISTVYRAGLNTSVCPLRSSSSSGGSSLALLWETPHHHFAWMCQPRCSTLFWPIRSVLLGFLNLGHRGLVFSHFFLKRPPPTQSSCPDTPGPGLSTIWFFRSFLDPFCLPESALWLMISSLLLLPLLPLLQLLGPYSRSKIYLKAHSFTNHPARQSVSIAGTP